MYAVLKQHVKQSWRNVPPVRNYLPWSFFAVTPTHDTLSVNDQSFEHIVGIPAIIMADGNLRWAHETDTRTAPEGEEVQEEHYLEEHTAL